MTRTARESLQIKAKVVFERGAYKKYVTRSKSAFNAELQARSRCVSIEAAAASLETTKPKPPLRGGFGFE